MLELDRISVFYGDVQVIFDLTLAVGEGEIVTLIGSNGAGKTTTVNTVSGIVRPASGDIRFEGASIVQTPPYKLVEMGLVQVPEGRLLFPTLTVRENLKLGAYSRVSRKAFESKLAWVFELFPRLQERSSQQARTMSGGEQQMLAIGRGLMSSPRLLILDEPSIGLAPLLVQEMFRVISEISRNGVSILLIEQNAFQALRASHRGYVLEHGHVTHEGAAESLVENDEIRAAYLGI
ncbi:MAG: ABC transporter ATP-binding protein [Rhodospirillaceae bacterium]|nr:ABC transporter ATP-binding protein [Rhodospirillaceae bacterium]MDP6621736.1 ABC transporter ATP-binding protein [Alphaproteobacteria bacterium]